MDGLAEDADVVFLLTTNRADLLEPALAAAPRPGRPGRGPRAAGRGRRAGGSSRSTAARWTSTRAGSTPCSSRTDGVTASFLKELLRRAAVRAAEAAPDGGEPTGAARVTADQLDAALDELLDTRNAMTRVLLGGQRGSRA